MGRNGMDAICNECGQEFYMTIGNRQICPTCLKKEGVGEKMITIEVNEKELQADIHALIEERDRVVRGHGNQYGNLTLDELNAHIARLQKCLFKTKGT